ncbi:XRE family transcriptional regulator [Kitasatospora sp. MMS16-BH015]|uniref:helix-turn-helix domain-containing protein n=1 Tax=Kitasatospora sp. MMS16-BH015 TaxID=2018025 RepID=UPI000CA2D54F|nr:helix-turn-helix transcriptional regulator [Kitasatospora sp. MMS16-BH015]AUG76628.1 XRE family transcriptional regulator [Kitasatospora sp. MMS16-BH015]
MSGVQGGHGGAGAVARRLQLGSQLRRLREASGVTRESAGYEIRASESKISRMELGRVGFKQRDVADLLTLYGVTRESERAALLALVGETNTPGWWHAYGEVVPPWFQTYLGLEEAAREISSYEVQFIHGLLQTEEYARAVCLLGNPNAAEEDIERRVAVRMRRQHILRSPDGPRLLAVMDEAALRRPCGGREVMRAQLSRLGELAEHPRITLLVMPLGVGGLAAESGAFTVLGFDGAGDLPDQVYLEQFTTAIYLDRPAEVAEYRTVLERLRVGSLSAEGTLGLLETALQDL